MTTMMMSRVVGRIREMLFCATDLVRPIMLPIVWRKWPGSNRRIGGTGPTTPEAGLATTTLAVPHGGTMCQHVVVTVMWCLYLFHAPERCLNLACRHGWAGTVLVLLQLGGVRIDYVDRNGQTALATAVSSGNLETTGILLRAGSKADFVNPRTGRNILAMAIDLNENAHPDRVAIIRMLAEYCNVAE